MGRDREDRERAKGSKEDRDTEKETEREGGYR